MSLIPDLNQIDPIHIPISPLKDMFKLTFSTSDRVFQALPFRHSSNHKPVHIYVLPRACYMPHPSHPP